MNEIAGKEEPFGGKHIMDITEKRFCCREKQIGSDRSSGLFPKKITFAEQ